MKLAVRRLDPRAVMPTRAHTGDAGLDLCALDAHRIGPGEIEDCLIRHPAIALAAVVGKPDALRTEIVKAFLVLKPGFAPSTCRLILLAMSLKSSSFASDSEESLFAMITFSRNAVRSAMIR